MKNTTLQLSKRWQGKALFAMLVACCLLLLTTATTLASTVNISDQANVLDKPRVQNEAANLGYPINIYTTNTFNGTGQAFLERTRSHLTSSSSDLVVMAIDTVGKHFAVVGGTRVPIRQSQYDDARSAFQSNFGNGDYTGATIAALHSLENAIASNSSTSSDHPYSAVGGFSLVGPLCCIGLLILAGIAIFAFVRRRSGFRRGPVTPGPMYGQPYNQYNQPYNQGYPPNYGPGYNQGGGINPLAAGGLGAAAGGLAGYELGRMAGEREEEREMRDQGYYGDNNFNNDGNNNGFGGGSVGDFGNGNGGDFGGGSAGDFGGGSGGDFGGGSGGSF